MIETDRLTLSRPSLADVDDVFAISSDPRVWTHYPSLRPIDPTAVRLIFADRTLDAAQLADLVAMS